MDHLVGRRSSRADGGRCPQQIRPAWLGESATDYLALDRNIPVRVRYPDASLIRRRDGSGQTVARGIDGRISADPALAAVVPARRPGLRCKTVAGEPAPMGACGSAAGWGDAILAARWDDCRPGS